MRQVGLHHPIPLFGLVCSLLVQALPAPPLFAQERPALETRTLARQMDPVVLSGESLAGLLQTDIAAIRVFRHDHGRLEPVPFQIDERNRKGGFCYTRGTEVHDEDASLDANDELVFLTMDVGGRVDPKEWLPDADRIVEVEISDPLTRQRGWAYIAHFPSTPPPKSDTGYMRHNRVVGKGGYDSFESPWLYWLYPWGSPLPSQIAVPRSAGGSGENFADRYKFRMRIRLLFKSLKFQFDEENIRAKMDSCIDGPIRVIWNVSFYMKIGLGLRTPSLVMDYIYYPHWTEVPAKLGIPVSPRYLCSELYIETGTDYNQQAVGCMMYNSENPGGVMVDGRMSPEELLWNPASDNLRLISGPVGTYLTRALVAPEVLEESRIEITTGYRDDLDAANPPENNPGEIGHLYQHMNAVHANAGTFNAYWDFYFPPNFRYPEDVDTVLNIRDHPVETRVTPLK